MAKYLDSNGVLYLWSKIKTYFTGTATPSSLGSTAAVGTSTKFARQDHVHPGYSAATTAAAGLMSAEDKATLDGLVSTGGEVNQNAWSNIKVGSTTIEADSKSDTFELTAGSNITLTPDATNDKVTIAATNTTYTNMTQSTATTGTSTAANTISAKVLHDTIASAISAAQVGAATFQGTVNAGTTISSLTAYSRGWYWVVATAGTYVGQTCEVGDMIFCISDYSSSYSASDFTVVQNNLDISAIENADIDTIIV